MKVEGVLNMPKGFEDFSFSAYVKTLAADNLVIDKLTQGAYMERRSVLENNGVTAIMLAPGTSWRRGKFFPRGCRGFISTVEVYCDNEDTAGHTLYIYISPQPEMGRLISLTLTVPAGSAPAWRSVDVRRFWNHDSMFIYVLGDSALYPRVGYDSGTPYDYVFSSDEVTWYTSTTRFWYRVNMAQQTVGDIPVSGIINTIEVPHITSFVNSGVKSLPSQAETTLLTIQGAGKIYAIRWSGTDSSIYLRFYIDDNLCEQISFDHLYVYGFTASSPAYSLLKYVSGGDCFALCTIPFEFRRKFELRMWHYTGTIETGQVIVDYALTR